MLGEALTHWTIRLALLCMVARYGGALAWCHRPWWFAASRAFWTLGCVFFLLHVASAFHFYHSWSHEHAFDTTAERTYGMLGVRFGEGIYFSYLFALLWTSDVAWQWLAPAAYRNQPAWRSGLLLTYMAFIAFNGAVVFEGGVTRTVGIPVTIALLVAGAVVLLRQRGKNLVGQDSP
jgi:hypothetical protein